MNAAFVSGVTLRARFGHGRERLAAVENFVAHRFDGLHRIIAIGIVIEAGSQLSPASPRGLLPLIGVLAVVIDQLVAQDFDILGHMLALAFAGQHLFCELFA